MNECKEPNDRGEWRRPAHPAITTPNAVRRTRCGSNGERTGGGGRSASAGALRNPQPGPAVTHLSGFSGHCFDRVPHHVPVPVLELALLCRSSSWKRLPVVPCCVVGVCCDRVPVPVHGPCWSSCRCWSRCSSWRGCGLCLGDSAFGALW
jgi:hypothetical protein